jgi:hypothetical protein
VKARRARRDILGRCGPRDQGRHSPDREPKLQLAWRGQGYGGHARITLVANAGEPHLDKEVWRRPTVAIAYAGAAAVAAAARFPLWRGRQGGRFARQH